MSVMQHRRRWGETIRAKRMKTRCSQKRLSEKADLSTISRAKSSAAPPLPASPHYWGPLESTGPGSSFSLRHHSTVLRHLTLLSIHPNLSAMINATPTQLRKAADIQEKIQSLQQELDQLLGGEVSTPAPTTPAPKKYKFSAAARAKMRRAQKARWAKIKGTAPAAKPAPK